MTTYSANCGRNNNFSLILFFLIIAAFAIAFVGLQVIPQFHAENVHPNEAESVRFCIKNTGPFMVFREPDKQTYHLLCNLPSGVIGDQIVKNDKGNLIEKTAYVPKDRTLKQILDWLFRKGATKYTGELK